MCIEMDSRCVLFTLLQTRQRAELSWLPLIRKKLKEKAPQVYVDLSDAAVYSAVEENSNIIVIFEYRVERKKGFAPFQDERFLDRTINHDLPKALRGVLHEVCASIDKPSTSQSKRGVSNERIQRSGTRIHRRS